MFLFFMMHLGGGRVVSKRGLLRHNFTKFKIQIL